MATAQSGLRVAMFQESGAFSAESFMIRHLDLDGGGGAANVVSRYTVCARFSLLHQRGSHSSTFLSYGNNVSDNFVKGDVKTGDGPSLTKVFLYQQFKESGTPVVALRDFEYRRWYHACLAFRHDGGRTAEVALYFDGEKKGSCE